MTVNINRMPCRLVSEEEKTLQGSTVNHVQRLERKTSRYQPPAHLLHLLTCKQCTCTATNQEATVDDLFINDFSWEVPGYHRPLQFVLSINVFSFRQMMRLAGGKIASLLDNKQHQKESVTEKLGKWMPESVLKEHVESPPPPSYITVLHRVSTHVYLEEDKTPRAITETRSETRQRLPLAKLPSWFTSLPADAEYKTRK